MKKALVILLLVVIVFTGLPLFMGMPGMTSYQACDPAVLMASCAVAVVASGVSLTLALIAFTFRSRRQPVRLLLHSFLLERPPRLA